MPHKDRKARLEYLKQHHAKKRPSPSPVGQGEGLPPLGQVITSEDGMTVQCHICGGWFKSLPSHIRLAHEITAADYKEEFELARGKSLWSPHYQEVQRQAALARNLGEAGRAQLLKIGPNPREKGVKNRLSSKIKYSAAKQGTFQGRERDADAAPVVLKSRLKPYSVGDTVRHIKSPYGDMAGRVVAMYPEMDPPKVEIQWADGRQRAYKTSLIRLLEHADRPHKKPTP